MKARHKKQLSRRLKLSDGNYEAYLFSGEEVERYLGNSSQKNKTTKASQKKKAKKISSVSIVVEPSNAMNMGSVKNGYGIIKISDDAKKIINSEGSKRVVKAATKQRIKKLSISSSSHVSCVGKMLNCCEPIIIEHKKPVGFDVTSTIKSGKKNTKLHIYDGRLHRQGRVLNPKLFSLVVEPSEEDDDEKPKR
ncbi:MAG: hypothetical protein IJK71_03465 [Clostridia bacterium]|nr:hypothetical protein [Clostridia bacterium]